MQPHVDEAIGDSEKALREDRFYRRANEYGTPDGLNLIGHALPSADSR
jgi:hypothetical protein